MLTECLEVFSYQLDNKGLSLILDSYIPADGTYLIVGEDGKIQGPVEIKMDKKTRELDKSSPLFPKICQYDYYSQLISMNKPMDAKKVIHSNSYLSFFVKKESIVSQKLTDEIIDGYYDTLLNPAEKKYKNSKEARRIYEMFAEQNGQVNAEEVEKRRTWIKENVRSIPDVDMTQKDYLKIFFEADNEAYEREGQRYFLPNVYNSNDYNIEIDGAVYGLPDNNLGMNAKKPFLSIKTRKYSASYLLDNEKTILQKKFFDYLMNLVAKGLYNVYVDTDKKTIKGYKNGEAPSKIETGYYLRLRKGKTEAEIHAQDNMAGYHVELTPTFYFENIVGAAHRKHPEYMEAYDVSYRDRITAGNLINEVLFSKWLNSSYGMDAGDVSITDGVLKQNVLLARDAIYDWVYKGIDHGFQAVLGKAAYSLVKGSISHGYVERALWQMNLLYSFRKYFAAEGEEDMAEIIRGIKSSIESKVLGNSGVPIENDREYYYAIGQMAAFLISLNKSREKKQSLINPFLNAKSNDSIRRRIMQIYKKYNYAISENSIRVKTMLALIEGYEPEQEVNQEMILLGYASDNVIYTKEEK